MKATCLAAIILAACAIFAYAQSSQPNGGRGQQVVAPSGSSASYYQYPYGYQFSSTAGEGYARGMADVVRAKGDYNLSSSAAAVNLGEARRREIDNAKQWTQTYFDMREINRQHFLAEQQRLRGNPDAAIRYSQSGKYQRLSPSELNSLTGEISWPVLLTAQQYAEQCGQVQRAFATRAGSGAMNAEDLLKVIQLVDDMIADLKSQIRELPPEKYIATKQFLEGLAYEAGQPVG